MCFLCEDSLIAFLEHSVSSYPLKQINDLSDVSTLVKQALQIPLNVKTRSQEWDNFVSLQAFRTQVCFSDPQICAILQQNVKKKKIILI